MGLGMEEQREDWRGRGEGKGDEWTKREGMLQISLRLLTFLSRWMAGGWVEVVGR